MAAAPITISEDRKSVIDFTEPFMDVGLSVLYKKPGDGQERAFEFVQLCCFNIVIYIPMDVFDQNACPRPRNIYFTNPGYRLLSVISIIKTGSVQTTNNPTVSMFSLCII